MTSAPRQAGILDVAALAGVSPSTVSRALRGQPNVSAATRQRVLEAAASLAYEVSPAASHLASGRTSTVGLVVPYLARWFFATAVAGACDVLRGSGYDVLLQVLGGIEGRDLFFTRMPLRRRVDAVILMTLPLDDDDVASLRRLACPVVTVGVRVPGMSSVGIDDAEATVTALRHLSHQGHRDLVMLTATDGDLGFPATRVRRRAFREALETAGSFATDRVVPACGFGIAGGAWAAEAVLARPDLPTALFCEYDELAIGALHTLRRAGVQVPQQVSVVGIDDHDMSEVVGLTTVAQPVAEQGAAAARLLLEELRGERSEPVDVVVPTRLVMRASTGRPGAGPPVTSAVGSTGPAQDTPE